MSESAIQADKYSNSYNSYDSYDHNAWCWQWLGIFFITVFIVLILALWFFW